jgi:hypothetical protein
LHLFWWIGRLLLSLATSLLVPITSRGIFTYKAK